MPHDLAMFLAGALFTLCCVGAAWCHYVFDVRKDVDVEVSEVLTDEDIRSYKAAGYTPDQIASVFGVNKRA